MTTTPEVISANLVEAMNVATAALAVFADATFAGETSIANAAQSLVARSMLVATGLPVAADDESDRLVADLLRRLGSLEQVAHDAFIA